MAAKRFLPAIFIFSAAAFMAGQPAYAGASSGANPRQLKGPSASSDRGGFELGAARPAGPNSGAQISKRALWLFHVLLRADKGFAPSESQPFESWLRKDGRFAVLRLAELMKELNIPLSDKQALRRILTDFYTEKTPAERQALFQKGMGHAQGFLAESWLPRQARKEGHLTEQPREGFIAAFHEFVDNIKERYVVLNLTARQRRAIEKFRELLAARKNGSQTGEITGREARQFRKVLKALNIPGQAQNDALVMDYLTRFFAEAEMAAEGKKASGAPRAAEAAPMKNYYEILGISPEATQEEIKKAYKRMAQQTHGDRKGKGEEEQKRATEKMQELNEARRVLRDSKKKAEYDAKFAGSQGAEAIKSKGARASDRAVWEVLREMRGRFDQMHYSQLKEMGKFSNFVRGFGPQFIGFSMAMGAAIYTKKYTDPVLYGVHRDPGELNDAIEHLKDWGSFGLHAGSFAVFIAAANKTNVFFYGSGIKHDSRYLRSLAPVAGLAAGYMASTLAAAVFQELFVEEDVKQCIFRGEFFEREHLNPCERLYLKWVEGQGGKYAVDLLLVIGSMLLAHKAAQALLGGIRIIPGGAAALAGMARAAGPRLMGYFGFFATIYLFMKTHFIADSLIGEKLKEFSSFRDTMASALNFLRFSRPGASIDEESFVYEAKALGYKFALWAAAKASHYERPLYHWTLQTNKIVSDYEVSSSLLKFLFQSAFAPYGESLPAAEEAGFEAKNLPFDFAGSGLSFLAAGETAKRRLICPYLAAREELRLLVSRLAADCFRNEGGEAASGQTEGFKHHADELLYILYWYLIEASQTAANQESAGGPAAPDLSPMPPGEAAFYLGADPDELFSSGSQAASELSAEKKWRLADALLEGYFTENLSLYYSEAAFKRAEEGFCAFTYPHEENGENGPALYNDCLEKRETAGKARELLLRKMAAAAVYLMNDIRQSDFELDVYMVYPELQPRSFFGLASLMKVYRKGEGLFEELRDQAEMAKNRASGSQDPIEKKNLLQIAAARDAVPALFLNMICGAPEAPESGGEAESHLFAAPALFDGLPPEACAAAPVFSVKDGGYAPQPDELAAFRSFLFGRRARLFGENYENLWLALEAYVRKYFPKENMLLDMFEMRSGEALDRAAALALENLDLVTERHFIPELINRAAFEGEGSRKRVADAIPAALSDAPAFEGEGSCSRILDYYDVERAARERGFLDGGFLEGFKGLEVYIFQSLFWMRQLKALKMQEAKDSQPALKSCLSEDGAGPDMDVYCPEPFSEAAYDKALCQAAELLQSYHDSYAAGQSGGPRIFSPRKEDLKEIEKKIHPKLSLEEKYFLEDNREALPVDPSWDPVEELKALYPEASLPIWTPQKFAVFSILQKSYPEMSGLVYLDDMDSNRNYVEKENEAPYAIIVEMRKSLNMFFRAMTALRAGEEARAGLRQ